MAESERTVSVMQSAFENLMQKFQRVAQENTALRSQVVESTSKLNQTNQAHQAKHQAYKLRLELAKTRVVALQHKIDQIIRECHEKISVAIHQKLIEVQTLENAHQEYIRAFLSVVGSFTHIHLRYANQPTGTVQEGYFEIMSLVGTFNDTSHHLHVAVSNEKGQTFGGHMLAGNLVNTTAEVVVAELEDLIFSREKDEKSLGGSGWNELVIKPMI